MLVSSPTKCNQKQKGSPFVNLQVLPLGQVIGQMGLAEHFQVGVTLATKRNLMLETGTAKNGITIGHQWVAIALLR
jgi:hypothetical protein